jgi:hypothetical protein
VPPGLLLVFANALFGWVPYWVLAWDPQGQASQSDLLRLSVIWTALVLGLRAWLPLIPRGSTSPSRHRIRYLYLLVVGLVLISTGGPNLVYQSGLASMSRVFAQPVVVPIIWITFVFLLLVLLATTRAATGVTCTPTEQCGRC